MSAAVLLLVPLGYSALKRLAWLKERIGARLSLARGLAWHVNASIGGAFLAVLHSGHRFDSWLGIFLMAAMLLAILSGYAGRYFLGFLTQDLKAREDALEALQSDYDRLAAEIAVHPAREFERTGTFGLRSRIAEAIGGPSAPKRPEDPGRRVFEIAEAMVDTEYAIVADETLKRKLRIWLAVHIAVSVAFYGLLALHVWGGIQFGLRWFS